MRFNKFVVVVLLVVQSFIKCLFSCLKKVDVEKGLLFYFSQNRKEFLRIKYYIRNMIIVNKIILMLNIKKQYFNLERYEIIFFFKLKCFFDKLIFNRFEYEEVGFYFI